MATIGRDYKAKFGGLARFPSGALDEVSCMLKLRYLQIESMT